jgi:hypothetical protein
MTTLRASRNGEFNDAYLLIEYPAENFAGGLSNGRDGSVSCEPCFNANDLPASAGDVVQQQNTANAEDGCANRPITSNSDLRPTAYSDGVALLPPLNDCGGAHYFPKGRWSHL